MKGPKLIVPPGTGAGSASRFSFKPLEGQRQKVEPEPLYSDGGAEDTEGGVPGVEGMLTTSVNQSTPVQGLINLKEVLTQHGSFGKRQSEPPGVLQDRDTPIHPLTPLRSLPDAPRLAMTPGSPSLLKFFLHLCF